MNASAPAGIARTVSRARAQRLVAQGRLIVSAFALVAAATGTILHGGGAVTLIVLASWTAFGIFAVWHSERRSGAPPRPWVPIFDLVVIATVILISGGIASPYFPLLVLPPFAVSFLFGRKAIALMIPFGLAIYLAALTVTRGEVDPRLSIMRFGAVLLLALGVVRRANYDSRLQEDLERLATWPRGMGSDRDESVRELLVQSALTLRAPRAALVWSEAEGGTFMAILSEPFEIDEEDPGPIVMTELGEVSSFLDTGGRDGLRNLGGSIAPFSGPYLATAIRHRLASPVILGARFGSEAASGWLFLLDLRTADADDVMLAEVVARLVCSGLEQFILAEMIRDGAATRERIRLSRDLHDGLLQSLSGLALHVQVARRSMTREPGETEQRLGTVIDQLAESQRALRDFVDELRPEVARRREPFGERLHELAESIARRWSVPVSLSAEGDLDAERSNDVVSIVAEALTNAAKHAGATRIEAIVRADDAGVRVDVTDDGRGFPFHGHYELSQLVAEDRGPWSIKERVISLGGELAIDSSSQGSRVEVRLPRAS